MGIIGILLTSIGLAMDAGAASICKGLCIEKVKAKQAALVGAYFGIFQALMPLLGYLAGMKFAKVVSAYDHWIAFVLLFIIGLNMIIEALKVKDYQCDLDDSKDHALSSSLKFRSMFLLAIATSIDALAVGISFSLLDISLPLAVTTIGVVTFLISFAGVYIGNKFGPKMADKAQVFGGVVLILIGLKILLEHLGVISGLPLF